ncbi:hypothetical protein ABW20_dc0100822 [Dactylellina cionopaga]|nr:hypothetical protein ABW20_dc0100822 [Dactylellina cionopaga]
MPLVQVFNDIMIWVEDQMIFESIGFKALTNIVLLAVLTATISCAIWTSLGARMSEPHKILIRALLIFNIAIIHAYIVDRVDTVEHGVKIGYFIPTMVLPDMGGYFAIPEKQHKIERVGRCSVRILDRWRGRELVDQLISRYWRFLFK